MEEPDDNPEETSTTSAVEGEADPRHAERLGDALAALDDEQVHQAVTAMTEQSRTELADTLQLPRATMRLGNALAPLLRRKLRTATPARQLSAAFALTEAVNDETVQALGAHHEDPSREDMLAALPDVIEHHGAPLVTLLLAAYSASEAPCQAVCADLLDTDERFAIGEAIDHAEPVAPTATSGNGPPSDAADLEARREDRKAAKAARRDAQHRQRASQEAAHAARIAAQHRAKRAH